MSMSLAPLHSASVRRTVLLPLLALDALLIAQHAVLYVLQDLGWINGLPRRLDITQEGSVSEILNLGKWLVISMLLLVLWVRSKMSTALGFAVVFAVVAADDLLMLHERNGSALVRQLGLEGMLGLRAQDMGELLVWGLLGIIVVGAVLLGHLAANAAGRRVGRALLGFLGLLVLFAVGFDMLHSLFASVRGMNFLLGMVEDGGETIIGSLCLAFCAALLASVPRAKPSADYPVAAE